MKIILMECNDCGRQSEENADWRNDDGRVESAVLGSGWRFESDNEGIEYICFCPKCVEAKKRPKYIIVAGEIDEGFRFYGPFNKREDADDFAASLKESWWLKRLVTPKIEETEGGDDE